MTNDTSTPVLDSIKLEARLLQRERDLSRHDALDQIARARGYHDFRHARKAELSKSQPHDRQKIYITASWFDGARRGREILEIEFGYRVTDLLTHAQMRKSRSLRPFRIAAPDHIASRVAMRGPVVARSRVCHVARILQFVEATGLRPSDDGARRALPGVHLDKQLPAMDHSSIWVDPATSRCLMVDEPYASAVHKHVNKRQEWATSGNFEIVASPWAGMYYPEQGSQMWLVSHRDQGPPLAPIIQALEELPPPTSCDPWTGHSSPASPAFISPLRAAALAVSVGTQ